jgi:hypothetical protein
VDNPSIWFGVNKDASVTQSSINLGIIPTSCNSNGTCNATSFEIADDWLKLFLLKNASADLSIMNHEEFDRLAQISGQMYDSIIGTNDPDLSAFKNRGGKLVSYHGAVSSGCALPRLPSIHADNCQADGIIPTKGSLHYYDAVTGLDPNIHDFYRLFLSPGLGHCFGGNGAYPDGTFDAMRKWVEEGVAPEILNATSIGTALTIQRPLCPYPKKQYYDGIGNATLGEGFYCK